MVQSWVDPIGQVAWQVRAPPPPPPPAQHTIPAAQLVAVQGGVTHVITPPAAPPVQVCPLLQSAFDEQSCVAPVGQVAWHDAVVPGLPATPASRTLALRQQTSPPLQLAELAHDATVVVPVGQRLGLATHVMLPAMPPPPGTVQQVRVPPTQTVPAPHGTAPVDVVLTGAPSGLPIPPPLELELLLVTPPLLLLDAPPELELPVFVESPPLSLVDPPQAAASARPTETTKKIRAPFIKATSRQPRDPWKLADWNTHVRVSERSPRESVHAAFFHLFSESFPPSPRSLDSFNSAAAVQS